MVKKEYFKDFIEERIDVSKQETLLDESLEHIFIEEDKGIQRHSYVTYQHQTLNNMSIAYDQPMEVTLEESKMEDFYQEMKENRQSMMK